MPSASVKGDSHGPQECQDPIQKMGLLVEKKMRNLEKRKNKLENYKEELNNGGELNEDQQKAVDAYDSVITSLELCREFSAQIDEEVSEKAKVAKLLIKKQQEERNRQEQERVKQVLRVQNVLSRLSLEEVRAEFLAGTNGAITLTKEKLKLLDDIHKLITPPIEDYTSQAKFKIQLQTCAENMMTLLDGKNKSTGIGCSYREMKTIISQIANCAFPKTTKSDKVEIVVKSKKNKTKTENLNGTTEKSPPPVKEKSPVPAPVVEPVIVLVPENEPILAPKESPVKPTMPGGPPPGISAHPIISSPPKERTSGISMSESSQSPCSAQGPLSQTQTYYSRTQAVPVEAPLVHPPSLDINEFATSGNFNFLQESQVQVKPDQSIYMDPAVVSFGSIKADGHMQIHKKEMSPVITDVSSIPTETFINQSYKVGMTNYPQPVPTYSSPTPVVQQHQQAPLSVPAPIPLPVQPEEKSTFSPPERLQQESTSWADQSSQNQEDNWGEVNGDNVWEEKTETTPTSTMPPISSWNDDSEFKNYDESTDRRSNNMRGGGRGYNNAGGRGGRGFNSSGGGGYRGNRGGNNNFGGGYQNNRGGRGFGSRGGFRGGQQGSNGSEFRGNRGGSYNKSGNGNNPRMNGGYRGGRGGSSGGGNSSGSNNNNTNFSRNQFHGGQQQQQPQPQQ